VDVTEVGKLDMAQLFDSLSEQQLAQLKFRSKSQHLDEGNYLVKEGDKGEEVYLILQGSVEVEVRIPGQHKAEVLAQLDEGEFVGEMVLLGQYYRSASVRATDRVEILVWKRKDLDDVFEANQNIGYIVMRNLATMLCERLRATDISLIKHISNGRKAD